jgi:hypothetical protein
MGMPQDMAQRKSLACVDDLERQSHVSSARRLIYDKNYAVNSTAVENVLKKNSLVPTEVCFLDYLKHAAC